MNDQYEDEFEEPERKSKSQKKREMIALQEMGERLCSMPPDTVRRLPIPKPLIEAALAYKDVRSHEARRRHMQYMGRLMREASDLEAITEALEGFQTVQQADNRHFQKLEKWRDALISGDADMIETIVAEHPAADRQRLRQLARNAAREAEGNKPPKSARLLFRYLRELSEEA
ncbi:ribosome-associated protein [Desulfobaculum xiamenense]|uniref:Ribosome-associated protein n=1 Tax=Desulfobaculum xiamenense TaxID=995050 RepID=A0A846QQA0_9BACT|nr:ribosome biogenesis factor YjgA [Desulfobaculum xiamenense]NJB67575.1 ribosome-associated protein [Desulfobaculum xiamenense]